MTDDEAMKARALLDGALAVIRKHPWESLLLALAVGTVAVASLPDPEPARPTPLPPKRKPRRVR